MEAPVVDKKLQLEIRCSHGSESVRQHVYFAAPSDLVADVVDDIAARLECWGLQPGSLQQEEIRLAFGDQDLAPDQRLEECGIQAGSVLEFATVIYVEKALTGERLDMFVQASEDVQSVRRRVEECCHGLSERMGKATLSFGCDVLTDSDRKLKDYGVRHGDTLQVTFVRRTITIFVCTARSAAGKEIGTELVVKQDEAVDSVRGKVQGILPSAGGSYVLLFNKQVLKGGLGHVLSDYYVQDGSLLVAVDERSWRRRSFCQPDQQPDQIAIFAPAGNRYRKCYVCDYPENDCEVGSFSCVQEIASTYSSRNMIICRTLDGQLVHENLSGRLSHYNIQPGGGLVFR